MIVEVFIYVFLNILSNEMVKRLNEGENICFEKQRYLCGRGPNFTVGGLMNKYNPCSNLIIKVVIALIHLL